MWHCVDILQSSNPSIVKFRGSWKVFTWYVCTLWAGYWEGKLKKSCYKKTLKLRGKCYQIMYTRSLWCVLYISLKYTSWLARVGADIMVWQLWLIYGVVIFQNTLFFLNITLSKLYDFIFQTVKPHVPMIRFRKGGHNLSEGELNY